MLRRWLNRLALLVFASAAFSGGSPEHPSTRLLGVMYDSIQNVRTVRMKIYALERIERRFLSANSEVKVQSHPRKVYFLNRVRKLEVLYDSETGSRALVKPNAFPFIPLLLEPAGALMRKNQHYTINELGFEFIGKSVALTIRKDRNGLNNFTYRGKVKRNGYNCHLIEYENRSYTYVDYTVGEKETATIIAYKLCVNDYLLRYRNDLLNDFGFLKKGRVLKVPSLYCRKAVIYLDERLMLPVSISLYDNAGLFESYDFSEIVVNKPFGDDEFTRSFPVYGF